MCGSACRVVQDDARPPGGYGTWHDTVSMWRGASCPGPRRGDRVRCSQPRSNDSLRHQVDDRALRPPALALGAQPGTPALNGVVLMPTVALRAAGAEEPVLRAVFASVPACGASAIVPGARTSGGRVDPSGRDPVGWDRWHGFGAIPGQWSFAHRCVQAETEWLAYRGRWVDGCDFARAGRARRRRAPGIPFPRRGAGRLARSPRALVPTDTGDNGRSGGSSAHPATVRDGPDSSPTVGLEPWPRRAGGGFACVAGARRRRLRGILGGCRRAGGCRKPPGDRRLPGSRGRIRLQGQPPAGGLP